MAFRILYNSLIDILSGSAVTSSGSRTSDYDEDNVIDDRVGATWRSDTIATEVWVKFDLGSAKSIDCIGIFNHNFTGTAAVTLEGNATDSWGSPTFSETLAVVTDSDSLLLKRTVEYFASTSLRWWRITITDILNSKPWIEIGRVMLGAYYEPTRNIDDDMRIEMIDPSTNERVPGQVNQLKQLNRYRRARVGFSYMDQTQADKLTTIFEKIGNFSPCMITWDTTRPTKDSMYAYLVTPLSLAHNLASYFDVSSIVFEEKTR